jgi:hypothetical protein
MSLLFKFTGREKAQLRSLRVYAERNPYSFNDLLDVSNGDQLTPGDQKEFVRLIRGCLRVVYTIENQKYDVRHVSVSELTGTYPSKQMVARVMEELGFERDLHHCYITLEDIGEKKFAISVFDTLGDKGMLDIK